MHYNKRYPLGWWLVIALILSCLFPGLLFTALGLILTIIFLPVLFAVLYFSKVYFSGKKILNMFVKQATNYQNQHDNNINRNNKRDGQTIIDVKDFKVMDD